RLEKREQRGDGVVPDVLALATARLEHCEAVVRAFEDVQTRIWDERYSGVQFLDRSKGVAVAGAEERRDADLGQVGVAALLRLPGRMQRVGEERQRIDRLALGYYVRGDAAAHRAPANDQAL